MSVIIQTRGEAGGGVAAHLQCPHCGQFSKSHAQQLSHMAASHPACLDSVSVGRLGNILMYQSSGHLFHCSHCFYTSKDFTKIYKHIIAKHCLDEREGGGEGGEEEEEEEEGVKDDLKRKRSSEGEEEGGVKKDLKRKRSSEEGEEVKRSSEGEEDQEEEGVKDGLKGRKSSEEEEGEGAALVKPAEEEEEEGEGAALVKPAEEEEEEGEGAALVKPAEEEEEEGEGAALVKPAEEEEEEEGGGLKAPDEEEKNMLMLEDGGYRCLICGWRHKQKAMGVSHVVRKHDIPKAYASQAVRRDLAAPRQAQGGGAEDEEGAGMSEEMLLEEMKATAKVVRFISSRFVCLICGWKTKLKGFAISHVVRSHDVERPYGCKDCSRSFFLPSRLQQHIRAAHRPGRYACPFCCFRSQFLGGFRRHCSRCNAREEEGGGGAGGGGGAEEDDNEDEEDGGDKKETRGARKRRSSGRMMEEEEEEDEDDEDD